MNQNKKFFWAFLFLAAGLIFFRLPTLFELPWLDQTVAAYIGQEMREGRVLYREIWDIRLPGIYLFFQGISYLGKIRPWTIPMVDLIYNLLILGVLWLVTKSLWGARSALGTVFIYVLFSISPAYQGCWSRLEPEMLMNLPLVLYLYSGYQGIRQQKDWLWFFSGFFFGLAFIIKFTVLFFSLPLIILWGIFPHTSPPVKNSIGRKIFYLMVGGAIPIAATVLYLYFKGALGEAYEATVLFSCVYATLRLETHNVFSSLLKAYQGQIIFTVAVFLLCFLGLAHEKFYRAPMGQVLLLWILGTPLAVYTQGKYFGTHFLTLIPPLAILAGHSLGLVKTKSEGKKPVLISLLVVTLLSAATGDVFRDYIHAYKPSISFFEEKVKYEQVVQALPVNRDKLNLLRVGRYIAQNSREDEYVYVWGIDPEIYYYSGKRCPSRFLSHYYLMDAHNPMAKEYLDVKKRQQELLRDLKGKPVKFFLLDLEPFFFFEGGIPFAQLKDFPELYRWVQDNYFSVGNMDRFLIFQKKPDKS